MDLTESDAIMLLRKYATDERSFEIVLNHSRAVQAVAVRIANDILSRGYEVDINFIRIACLLHDIGRFQCPPGKDNIKHGVIGADIIRKEGISERYALVCERHIGSGITLDDIEFQNLDLPKKNYVPLSTEEKIISYADSLIFGDREGTISQVIERYRREVGESLAQKTIELHNEIEQLRGGKNFITV